MLKDRNKPFAHKGLARGADFKLEFLILDLSFYFIVQIRTTNFGFGTTLFKCKWYTNF